MKLIVIAALALVAVVAAAPAEREPTKIVRSDFEQNPEGGYSYAYETDDGTSHSENAEKKVVNDEENKPQEILSVRGQYSYVDPEGKQHNFAYFADETGFHVESEDVPKGPSQA